MNSTFESCLTKQAMIKKIFIPAHTLDQKYQTIISLGKTLAPYPMEARQPQNIIQGCQSLMYLHAELSAGRKMLFFADSEALISRGLAAILISIYHEEPPEVVLTCPPSLFEELGLYAMLSPSRSSGLSSLFLSMKQRALEHTQILKKT